MVLAFNLIVHKICANVHTYSMLLRFVLRRAIRCGAELIGSVPGGR